jgi:CRISPR-associated protein Csm4
MTDYRLIIRPRAPVGTPYQSDTLFGHFCWAVRDLEGEGALRALLDAFDAGQTPLVVSGGFPSGCIPRPQLPPMTPGVREKLIQRTGEALRKQGRQSDLLEAEQAFKKLRKRPFLPCETLRPLLAGLNEARIMEALIESMDGDVKGLIDFDRLHNTINRLSNHTLERQGLFSSSRWVHPEDGRVDVYVRCEEASFTGERLKNLFDHLFRFGYGKDASTGSGHAEVVSLEEERDLFGRKHGTHALALSNFIPCDGLRVEQGCYRLATKLGKLGRGLARNPFKKPLLMVEAGASFPIDEARSCYGRWLRDVHRDRPEVRHSALMLPLFFNLAGEEKAS